MDIRTKFLVAIVNGFAHAFYGLWVVPSTWLRENGLKWLEKWPRSPHKPRVLMPNGTSYRA